MELGLAKLAAVYERPQRKNYTELLERLKARRTGSEAELGLAEILGLAKLAASFDARRTKQYWQLLKRLHGGNDEAVQAIKETRDPGIYHGTKAGNIEPILSQGMDGTLKSEYGKTYGHGSYFASPEIAKSYGHDLVRMALPSELKGSKQLYPDPTRVSKFTGELDPVGFMRANLHAIGDEMGMGREENREKILRHVHWSYTDAPLPEAPERYKLQYYGKSDHFDPTVMGFKSPLFQNGDRNDFVVVNQPRISPALLRGVPKQYQS